MQSKEELKSIENVYKSFTYGKKLKKKSGMYIYNPNLDTKLSNYYL